jgi:predicted metallopeptidase
MTISAIRTKVHKYIDEADIKVLEVVHQLLEVYRQNSSGLLTEEQKKEVLKRSALYKAGKTKGYSLSKARKMVKQKLSSKSA